MTIDEMIEIMEAYKNGETIQYCHSGQWYDTDAPCWNWANYNYRIAEHTYDINKVYKLTIIDCLSNKDEQIMLFGYSQPGRISIYTVKLYGGGLRIWNNKSVSCVDPHRITQKEFDGMHGGHFKYAITETGKRVSELFKDL